jgi:hypothetical protein
MKQTTYAKLRDMYNTARGYVFIASAMGLVLLCYGVIGALASVLLAAPAFALWYGIAHLLGN